MRKSLKILSYTLSGMVIFAIILPIVISIVLQIGAVQNFVVRKASEILSDMANTRISIGHVDMKFFTSVKLEDVLMEDLDHDTMIYARDLIVDINGINFFTGKISLGSVTLNHGQVNLVQDSTGTMNIDKVFKAFQPSTPNPNPPDFRLTAGELTLIHTSLSIRMHNAAPDGYGVNWQNFFFNRIDFQARDVSVFNYSAWFRLDHLNLTERSGWRVNHLSSTRCGVDSSGMYYAGVKLTSGDTRIELDSMNFLTANRSWWDWTDFEHKMNMRAIVRRADVSSATLGYIIGQKIENPFSLNLHSATMFGPLCDIRGGVRQVGFDRTRADIQYSVRGLPLIDSTQFDVRLLDLSTSGPDVNLLYSRITGGELVGGAYILKNSGDVNLTGEFSGRLQDFHSSVVLVSSNAGAIAANLNMRPYGGGVLMVGSVATENFDAGRILGVSSMGRVSLGGDMRAYIEKGKPMRLGVNALVSSLDFGSYTYHGIKAQGDVLAAGFRGSVACADTNMNFSATGLFDLSGKDPKYDFDMELRRADLNAVGFNSRDSISILSADLRGWATGRTIDDINGSCRIDNILYINHLDTVRTGVVLINSQNTPQLKEITLESDFADMSLRGRNSFTEIFRYFSQSLERFLPSFPEATQIVTRSEKLSAPAPAKRRDIPFSDGYYQLIVSLKDADNVASAFVPGLSLSDGSKLNFFFNPYLDQFSLHATSDLIESKTLFVENFVLDSRNHADSLSMFLTADYMRVAGIGMPDLSILGGVRNNAITLGGRFIDTVSRTNVLIRTYTTFVRGPRDEPQMKVVFSPTPITLGGEKWALSPASVLIDSTGFQIDNFIFTDGVESLAIEGHIGNKQRDTLHVMFRDVDLSSFSPLISDLGYEISGAGNGDIRVVSMLNEPRLLAAVDFKGVKLNNHDLGNPKLRSTFDRENARINFALGENLLSPPIQGYFAPTTGNWGGKVRFDEFDLSILEPMLSGILSSTAGRAKVDLELRGKGSLPELSGTVDIANYGATIDFTKVRYNLAGRVNVHNNRFELAPTTFHDQSGGKGTISAWFDSDHFQNLRYAVQASFTDLLALNTTLADNSSFFGKAWGTGRLALSGNESKTNIVIAAQTAGNSTFVLPMSSSSTIESADFIRFVDPNAPKTTQPNGRLHRSARRTQARSGGNELDIKIDLAVLPNTLAEIEFDAKIGDVIKGRGEGSLAMHINPSQDLFNMTGSVSITQGNYLFTLMTIFQRHFTINPGSTITWTGVPYNPLLNVGATYKVKTSLAPISTGVQSGVSSTANIDCGLNLSGNMLSPDISFSIKAPSADPEIQNLIRNAINTQETLSMQFLSLVLSNTFMPDANAGAIGTIGESFVGVTGLEFLTNQLSQMISSEKVRVRLGYRMGSTTSADEYYAGVGADIIDGVLSFDVGGNYATGNRPNYNTRNPFTVDAYLTWNINKKGTLKLQGFTRTIDRFDETQGLQESGVGVYFRQDFADVADLKNRLRKAFEKQKIDRSQRDSLRRAKRR